MTLGWRMLQVFPLGASSIGISAGGGPFERSAYRVGAFTAAKTSP
jgi:hypothetical protein